MAYCDFRTCGVCSIGWVTIRDLVGEGVCEVVADGMVVGFDFAEVCTDACFAAGFKGVCDR